MRRMVPYYNLDMIPSVGYRVNSRNTTQFRIRANKVLNEYLIKDYSVHNQTKAEQSEERKLAVRLLSNVLVAKDVTKSEAVGISIRTSRKKTANPPYPTVKNRSFSHGNKRIAAFLFLWFLENNGFSTAPTVRAFEITTRRSL